MSVFHFYRTFKEAFRCTPKEYILDNKLAYAITLRQKGMSLGKLAKKAGFCDLPAFSKIFKRRMGFSPSKFTW